MYYENDETEKLLRQRDDDMTGQQMCYKMMKKDMLMVKDFMYTVDEMLENTKGTTGDAFVVSCLCCVAGGTSGE